MNRVIWHAIAHPVVVIKVVALAKVAVVAEALEVVTEGVIVVHLHVTIVERLDTCRANVKRNAVVVVDVIEVVVMTVEAVVVEAAEEVAAAVVVVATIVAEVGTSLVNVLVPVMEEDVAEVVVAVAVAAEVEAI